MSWLFITILAYFFLALSSLFDRYLLAGPMQNPQAYAFFVGILGVFALALVPFGFEICALNQVLLSLLAGAAWILAVFLLYLATYQSEVSRVVPAIGGFLPIFSFIISRLIFPEESTLTLPNLCPFFLLVLGSVLITFEKEKSMTLRDLALAGISSLAFAIAFFLMKLVYLEQSFISGFIWMRLGGVMMAVLFLLSPETRQFVWEQKPLTQKRISLPFVLGQISGGTGFVLQNFAVALSKVGQIPLINALEGIRYIFLLFFVFVLSRKFPHILKEEISRKALLQKVLSVLLIGMGLALLALR